MNDREDVQDGARAVAPGNGDEVARLLQAAGPRPAAPEESTRRVRDAVHAHWRRTVTARRRAWLIAWSAVPAAAAAVGVVLIASGVLERMRRTPLPAAPLATLERSEGSVAWLDGAARSAGGSLDARSALETGADGRVALRLGGGASIRVDVRTRLRLISDDEIALDGGAVYVETAASAAPGTAVVVRTALGTVRDIGTRFQVHASPESLRVTVREGVAAIEHRGRSHRAPAGTGLTVDQDGGVTSRPVPPSDAEWHWVQEVVPPFDLEGRRLAEYLDWIGKETGLRIDFAEAAIPADKSNVLLHGSIEGLRPDETLEAVLPTCGLRHRMSGGAVVIERAVLGAAR
jgi:ferric-dicitrate binding protein FerR (iron transport regulator)